jgi:hypothetical protein
MKNHLHNGEQHASSVLRLNVVKGKQKASRKRKSFFFLGTGYKAVTGLSLILFKGTKEAYQVPDLLF